MLVHTESNKNNGSEKGWNHEREADGCKHTRMQYLT